MVKQKREYERQPWAKGKMIHLLSAIHLILLFFSLAIFLVYALLFFGYDSRKKRRIRFGLQLAPHEPQTHMLIHVEEEVCQVIFLYFDFVFHILSNIRPAI